jgi:hypothetical protein
VSESSAYYFIIRRFLGCSSLLGLRGCRTLLVELARSWALRRDWRLLGPCSAWSSRSLCGFADLAVRMLSCDGDDAVWRSRCVYRHVFQLASKRSKGHHSWDVQWACRLDEIATVPHVTGDKLILQLNEVLRGILGQPGMFMCVWCLQGQQAADGTCRWLQSDDPAVLQWLQWHLETAMIAGMHSKPLQIADWFRLFLYVPTHPCSLFACYAVSISNKTHTKYISAVSVSML